MNQIDTATNLGAPPEMGRIRTRANQIAFWSWCAMLFCIPFSTALGLLFSAIAVVSGLVGFSVHSLKTTIRQPAIALCVALFVWLTISMLWSIAPQAEMLEAWSKYRKLLYPALALMVLYNLKKSPRAMIYGFLAGTGLVALVSLSSFYGLLQILLGPPEVAGGWYVGPGWLFIGGPENPTFGRNHITQSAFLAFAAMIALGKAWTGRRVLGRETPCFLWILAALIYLQPIFLLQGRTGYLLAAALCLFWGIIALRYLSVRSSLTSLLLGGAIIATMVANSPHAFSRTKLMTDSIGQYVEQGKLSDSGVRMEFWRSGAQIFMDKPILGVGLGGYSEAYSQLKTGQPDWLARSRPQPHSEYVLMAVQGGIISLFIFIGVLLSSIVNAAVAQRADAGPLGLVILYFLNAAFNSVIWDLAEGHLLVLVMILAAFNRYGFNRYTQKPAKKVIF